MVQVTAPCGNWTAEPGLVPACQCHRSGQPQSAPTPRLAPNAVPTPHGRRTDTAGPRFRIGDLHLLESPAFLCPRVQSGLGAIVPHMSAWSSLRTPRRGLGFAQERNRFAGANSFPRAHPSLGSTGCHLFDSNTCPLRSVRTATLIGGGCSALTPQGQCQLSC